MTISVTPRERYITTFQHGSKTAGAAAMAVGGLVLIGWWLQIESLKTVLPGLESMKPNTAVCFVLAGLALWFLHSKSTDIWLLGLRRVCAGLMVLIGLLTLSEYIFGVSLGFDHVLFRNATDNSLYPGRMALVTAVNFLLLGLALFWVDVFHRYRAAQLVSLTAISFTLLALIGYLYGVKSLYSISTYSTLALHTTITFLILSLGVLFVRPQEGYTAIVTSNTPGGTLARRMLPAAVVVPILLGWLQLMGQANALYDMVFGVAIFASTSIIIFTVLIGWSAHELYETDVARQQANDDLRRLNAELDERVLARTVELTRVNEQLQTEVTEREQIETELRDSQERFSMLFRSSPVGILLTRTADGCYLDANERFLRQVGYAREEVIGNTADSLKLLQAEPRAQIATQIIGQGGARDLEVGLQVKSGEVRTFLISVERVEIDGEVCGLSSLYDITDRKRIEQESQRLKIALDKISEGAQMIGFDWRYIYVNDAAASQGQQHKDEMTGRSMMDVFPGIEQTPLFDILRRCMDTRTSDHMETPFTLPDNTSGWFDVRVLPIPEGIFILSTDITERRRADSALRESEAKLRALFEVLPVGISILDRERRVVETNPALERILQLTQDDLSSGRYRDRAVIHPDGTAMPLEALPSWQALEKQAPVLDVEMGIIVESGQTVWTSVSAVPVPASNLGVVVVTTDITERKHTEAALAQERDLLQALMDNVPDTIYFKDTASRFTRINQAQVRVLGAGTAEAALGKTDHDFFTAHVAEEAYAEEQLLLKTGKPVIDRPEFNPMADGTPRWFSSTKVPMFDRQGRATALVGISRDITNRMKSEEALQRANAQLTERVSQMSLLSDLAEQLLTCIAVEEVYDVTTKVASHLFRTEIGALSIINNSRNWVEPVSVWGAWPQKPEVFRPDDCWALRRGRTHLSGTGYTNISCPHLKGTPAAFSICIPLLAQGETLGVLNLQTAPGVEIGSWNEAAQQSAQVIADSVALTVANLKLRETLREQSIRDPLTGLFNRRYMEESLDRELHRADRKQWPVGLIMLDVDHFKQVNDSYGHDTGDAVLRQLGRFLKERTRVADIACRYGGEEFVLILPEANLDQTRLRAEQHRQDFKSMMQLQYGDRFVNNVTLSFGVAAFPQHGKIGSDLLKAADAALYRAKDGGRDQVAIAR